MNDIVMPVLWVNDRRRRWLARWLKPRRPAVLVVSLPRSGSSWAGEALGCAIDALYLREPVTQSDRTFYDLGTVFPLDRPEVAARYRALADRAFAGWPEFGANIVRFPDQWTLKQRRSRRVVIKEVNPLACGWYIQQYQPRIVYLIRHPAAVALSWQQNGWLGGDAASWAANGELQGRALQTARAALANYAAHRIVVYEELCVEPLERFRALFQFAGLTWDTQAQRFIAERVQQDEPGNTWNTSRNSWNMIHKWRKRAVPANVEALRATYRQFDLPWYREDEDWVV